MKIAVTYENGQVFQHFGHTENFKIYDIEEGKIANAVVISTAGKRPPLLALKNPGSSHVEIIDLPDRKSSAAAGLLLRKYGADRATVTFSSAYAGSIWNLPQLAKHLDIFIAGADALAR
jgi:predicted Fe-Mo cluster-binding NifX family protein